MTTIGRVDFIVGLDGSTLPRRAFVVGRQIGRSIASGMDRELKGQFQALGKTLERDLSIMGRRGGLALSNGLGREVERNLGPRLKSFFMQMGDMAGSDLARRVTDLDFGDWADDLGHLTVVVREVDKGFNQLAITAGNFGRGGGISDGITNIGSAADDSSDRIGNFHRMMENLRGAFGPLRGDADGLSIGFGRLSERFRLFGSNIRDTVQQGGGMRGFFNEFIRLSGDSERATDSLLEKWKAIPHGARQFAFYTALFANLAESIAVLGAAAGAGLLTLAGAATFAGVGLTAAIVGFTGLSGELDDLPSEIRPAVAALRGLGDEFGVMRRQLQIRTLSNLGGAFDSLRATVRGLTPDFAKLGDTTAGLVQSFSDGIAPGTRNFQKLQSVIRTSGPVFDRLMRIVGRFGEGLLTAFASPALTRSVNEMLDWIGGLADGFASFTESNGLDIWLGRASTVFGSVGRLLEATGTLLNNLVDAEAVGRLNGFLSNITGFMPSLERLLSVLGEFDVFGLIAQAFNDFGEALAPLAKPMEDLARGLNDVVQSGIDTLVPIFEDVAVALAPLVQSVADFINANPQAVADAMLAIAGAALILKGAKGLDGLASIVTTNLGGLSSSVKENDWKTIGSKMGKGGAAAFLPALVTGLFSGEGGAGLTIAAGAIGGLSVGGLPGLIAGALIGAIVSAFTDPGSWENGAQQIATFFGEGLAGILKPESWTNGWEQIKELNRIASEEIASGFETSWTEWGAKFENGRQQINTGVGQWWAGLMAAFANGAAQIGAAWSNGWTQISSFAATVWGGITKGVGGWWAGLMAAFANGANQIKTGWNSFWSGLGSILAGVWAGITSTVRGAVNGIIGMINGMIDAINGALDAVSGLTGGAIDVNISNIPKLARGAMVYSRTTATIGEAGPEAVVPLNRPLSQVDPAVRALSAFAQGKSFQGGETAPTVTTNVEPGAIVVMEAGNGMQTASAVLDRLVAVTAG